MHQPLRIEVADAGEAEALRRHLQPFDVETVVVDGHVEVRVQLVELNPERRVVNALNAVDAWLVSSGVPFARVHLDGSSYTLHAQPHVSG
jgi:hypothetical protein